VLTQPAKNNVQHNRHRQQNATKYCITQTNKPALSRIIHTAWFHTVNTLAHVNKNKQYNTTLDKQETQNNCERLSWSQQTINTEQKYSPTKTSTEVTKSPFDDDFHC
jgi:hypothetical protein